MGDSPLMQGVVLLIVGMSVVFAFLTLMVCAINLAAKVIARFAPAEESKPAVPVVAHRATDTEHHLAVLLAAVRHTQRGSV